VSLDPILAAKKVAVVGSPSTNSEVTLDLLDAATREPLVGSMLLMQMPLGSGDELALGTVTEVTTVNQWVGNQMLKGMVKANGAIPGLSGDKGDVRAATIKLQAVYKRDTVDQMPTPWAQSGPSLRMSPATGITVRQVTNEVIADLMKGEDDLHCLGHLHGTKVRIPFSIRDFSGSRGAFHVGFVGMSGSGKTAEACYYLGGQMRHEDLGMIIIDPQGQFASETGLPFSLQEFGTELGRDVMVHRVAEDLRLPKDAPLFGELLLKSRFTAEITKMSPETAELFLDELVKVLRKNKTWDETDSETLLRETLDTMKSASILGRVYADETRRDRLRDAIDEALTDDDRFADLIKPWLPLHNLFSPTNPGGQPRHSLWGTIARVFDKDARNGGPAPVLILDMSTSGQVSWTKDLASDEDLAAIIDAIRILDQDPIKAAILRKVTRTLKEASEDRFRIGETLNTMVVFDEGWRYAPPPGLATDPEIKALSIDLAGYARDTRKFGIGWTFITQSPRSINQDIWDQLSIRVIGYGLGGADLAKIAEQMDDPDHLKLYRGFAPPDSTKPKVYPFMFTGPVSPLSFTKAPVFLSAYTDFQTFRDDNEHWILPIRRSLGLPLLSGTPVLTGGPRLVAPIRKRARPGKPLGTMDLIRASGILAHKDNGGVDPASAVGLSRDPGFSDPLSALDSDEPPF
jgi:hypothetical protein